MYLEKVFRNLHKLDSFRKSAVLIQDGEQEIFLSGLVGSSANLITAALFSLLPGLKRLLLITAGVESASRAFGDLQTFLPSAEVNLFPFTEVLPNEELNPTAEVESQRLITLNGLANSAEPFLVVTPIQAIIPPTISPLVLKKYVFNLNLKQSLDRREFLAQVSDAGYQRSELVVEPGQFAVRGGIIDLFSPGQPEPLRIELSGAEVISLRYYCPVSQLSRKPVSAASILPISEKQLFTKGKPVSFLEYFQADTVLIFGEPMGIEAEEKKFQRYLTPPEKERFLTLQKLREAPFPKINLSFLPLSQDSSPRRGEDKGEGECFSFRTEPVTQFTLKGSATTPNAWNQRPLRIFCRNESQAKRFKEVISERGLTLQPESRIEIGYLTEGFSFPEIDVTFLTDSEIFGRYRSFRPGVKPFFQSVAISGPEEISPGDYVVHLNEGIGKFLGIGKIIFDEKDEEVIKIEYADGILLFVPVNQINLVHRYAGAEKPPTLSRLGSRAWLKTRERVTEGVRDLASDLLKIYQQRKGVQGFVYPADSPWQSEFEAEFIYEETPDQLTAIKEVKKDLQSSKPMDRLVCGDVGYGKTEVAMRAAFKAVEAGRQVALLCPTTILAEQHLRTFGERFADFPVRIENLSRFRSKPEQKAVIAEMAAGKVDIVIGTHRLLSADIRFQSLGMWIVDEEQRFGVTHKERLRARWPSADILTLSATPIPRTLQLSITGIRDLSVIETPPVGRQAVLTLLAPYREDLIVTACQREMERSGQVFFIHNRVENIARVAEHLRRLLPEAEIGISHGQMDEKELFDVMNRFLDQKIDILVATSIVESGLDIPNANTIIINDGQNFGLADLYQLRGRVGRYKTQAYCYLLYDPTKVLTDDAQKRLKAIEDFTKLGSGLRLALADLEIRGAGNILGKEQHGFIEAVGFFLYSQLFREAVAELTGQKVKCKIATAKIKGFIPENYVPSETVRLSLYRRLFGFSSDAEKMAQEMVDRFGPIPEETVKLLRSFTQT
ncbi:MAG: transcription-repair coupling factor [Candidatus Omnitrophica bacterium]|nr:transcription-repair coupling factor [Candidatus Omnitrophota bacterium]